jgi:hypothetical protein
MKAMNLRSALGLGIVCVGLAAGAPGRVKRYLGLGPELKLDYSAKDHKGIRPRDHNGSPRRPRRALHGLAHRRPEVGSRLFTAAIPGKH